MKISNTVNANEVNATYLFLGVGGCGCDIVKRIAKRCHPDERENISFVCMDTDVNDLKRIKDELPFVRTIQTSTTQTVGAFLDNDDDARKNWFPKSAVMYDKTMSEGAGQVRAISRLALDATIKTGRIRPLYDAIDALFRKTGKEMKQSMRCIIASSASGGTGSGMILPTAMLVREYVKEKYPNSALLTRALLLLPETLDSVIESQTERDSQARNGYATIKELNAFMIKGSGFVDLDPDMQQYSGLSVKVPVAGSDKLKTLSNLPIDFCFLMDGQDAEDSTLTKYEQYKEQAAIALYEQNIGPMHRKSASTEDNIIKELAKAKGRNRFGGIGAGIVKYPYDRIVDYIACDLAIDSIGGEGDAAKWTKYDKAFRLYQEKEKKLRTPQTEQKKKFEFYPEEMKNARDQFSKELQGSYLDAMDERIEAYATKLCNYASGVIERNTDIKLAREAVDNLALSGDSDSNAVKTKAQTLIHYHSLITEEDKNETLKIEKIVERSVESIFTNTDIQTASRGGEEYAIEKLFRFDDGEVTHPCAARCYLYALETWLRNGMDEASAKSANLNAQLAESISTTEYDLDGKHKTKGIQGIANLKDKSGNVLSYNAKKTKSLVSKCNLTFDDFITDLESFYKEVAKYVAYRTALEYVQWYSDEFEKFFDSFEQKTKRLTTDKIDIIEELRYKNGNAEMNICSEPAVLDSLSKTTVMENSKDSTLLTKEVNGAIFDQVKKNALYRKDKKTAGENMFIENTSKDIFDDTLMDYFKQMIRDHAEKLDVNIIRAIALEYEVKERLKNPEFTFNQKDAEAYIRTKLQQGVRIAAPSVQRMQNVEPREVKRAAYHKNLVEDRKYSITSLVENGDSCETVSEREIRFYNALYNVTPDKLKKFAAPYETETGAKEGGVYFKAYRSYSRHIGPDSTKNAAMSTHIDKRWDSIKTMPELDDAYQKRIVNNIHKAFIYGIIHDAIQHKSLSNKVHGKSIYTYYNSEDRYEELVVPNGTLCDEFYEILDSLYVNAKVVEDINESIKSRKRIMSIMKNCNYEGTEFFKDMASFNLIDICDGKARKPKAAEQIEKIADKIEECNNNLLRFDEWIKDPDLLKGDELRKFKELVPDAKFEGEFPTKDEIIEAKRSYEYNDNTILVENQTSLFAIPLVYYYSLPNSSRFISELTAMVDAVIDVFREEYETWEKEEDVKFVLCNRLLNEFSLLKKNYSKYTNSSFKVPENEEENEVLDIVSRRIQDVIRSSPEPEDYELLLDEIMRHSNSNE